MKIIVRMWVCLVSPRRGEEHKRHKEEHRRHKKLDHMHSSGGLMCRNFRYSSMSYPIFIVPPAMSGAENVTLCMSAPPSAEAIAQKALRLRLVTPAANVRSCGRTTAAT